MAQITSIKGTQAVLNKFKISESQIAKGAEVGLKKFGLLIQRESQKEVPVDQGVLKNSAFTRKAYGSGFNAVIIVGYTAYYAIFVHENLDAAHGEEYNQKHAEAISGSRERDTRGRFTGVRKNKRWHNRGAGQKAKFLEDPA